MILSKKNLPYVNTALVAAPTEAVLRLPEKVLQFGTGVLLRGLPDYYIDKANRKGLFNGRIAVVKSTTTGSADAFEQQNGLYTLHINGIQNKQKVEEQVICSAISRVLSADTEWAGVLAIARSADLQVIVSNTTEAGIVYVDDDITAMPPKSYPGKLLAVLYHRYRYLGHDKTKALVVLPTELLPDNGLLLKDIVVRLATHNKLEDDFATWLESNVHFCNTLVDRIVPGKPDAAKCKEFYEQLGYQDDLRIVAEPYSLWVIEAGPGAAALLSFSKADEGMVITTELAKYRELKLRLLNAPHTLCCALAFLKGFETVDQAMADASFLYYISLMMQEEIALAIPYPLSTTEVKEFIAKVLDRFRNPYIKHLWLNIAMQYSLKMRMRVIPLLLNYYKLYQKPPVAIALGFSAYIRLMKVQKTEGQYWGNYQGKTYPVTDNSAPVFEQAWQNTDAAATTDAILKNTELWGTDLSLLPGFKEQIVFSLGQIESGNISYLLALLNVKV